MFLPLFFAQSLLAYVIAFTVLSSLWLLLKNIPAESTVTHRASMKATFALLKDKQILLLFLGIVFVVGSDVGMNTITPKLLKAIQARPKKANELSGLMITGVLGGAVVPPIMGQWPMCWAISLDR